MIVTDRLVSSFDDIMDYSFTANFENELDRIANGELNWKEVLNSYYSAFQDDLLSAMDEDNGMAPNLPTMTNINCPECKKNNLTIRNASNGVFLGCAGYSLPADDQCKKTLNLISGDEAVSVDDQEEAEHLVAKRRCPKCDMSMDNYLLDENHKLHVCSNNPDCDGFEVEEGTFKIKGYDGPTLSCHKCGSEMQLKTGRFGKYFGCKYLTNAPRIYSSGENAQEAHEAIRPTNASTKSEGLISSSDEEKRLYELIWQQFIGSQLPDAEYLATNAKIQLEEYIFSATGREVVFDGFTRIVKSKSDDQDANILPPLEVNQKLTLKDLENKQKYTKPPARFSEAALVRELEKRGIGRPSTYANIISTIQDRGYVEIQNRRFFVKKIGMIVTDRLVSSFDDIMDYSFTANFENELDRIANGELNWKEVLNSYYSAFQDDLLSAMDEDNGMAPNLPTMTNINCPECKKNNLTIRNASNGVFLGCAGYSLPADDQCKKTLNLISGDEAVSVDDQEEAEHLVAKRRCPKCDMSMDNYLLDENHKLHVCSNNPDCDGFEVEEGTFKIKGYDGPTLSCHKCGSEMQLKTGRFGKYFGCMNDNCGATRALQRNGEPKPIVMEPIITEIPCIKFEDNYLLRDSMKGLFLAASKYPKNRETRAPSVEEFNKVVTEETLLDACKYLEDQGKHTHLLNAPKHDTDGNPYIIRYNKVEDTHYLASEKDGKKTGNTASHNGDKWVEVSK